MAKARKKEKPVAQSGTAISISGIGADYGNGKVIDDINFDIKTGETFGLMGLNGVGKTTLIKIILGLLEPTEGQVSVFGRHSLDPESKMNLAFLPENFVPPSFLSGLEFVRFSLNFYKKPFSEEKVFKAADRLALAREALTRRVTGYSKGMRQKTGLMGTLLTECPLLILDEPMSGLDPKARALVKDEIMAYRASGKTVFLSSHILADMDELCDRVAIIHDRRLQFVGTPAELKKLTAQEYLERAFLEIIEGKKRK